MTANACTGSGTFWRQKRAMPPSIRLPDSLGLDASGIARRAAEWIRWYLK